MKISKLSIQNYIFLIHFVLFLSKYFGYAIVKQYNQKLVSILSTKQPSYTFPNIIKLTLFSNNVLLIHY